VALFCQRMSGFGLTSKIKRGKRNGLAKAKDLRPPQASGTRFADI
jgi:hypothetical protein